MKSNASIMVEYYDNSYVKGKGAKGKWKAITYKLSPISPEYTQFPAEWVNAYGRDVYVADSMGITQPATVRVGFNPLLNEKLNTAQVRIYLNGETDPNKAYSVLGSCDNVRLKNNMLEFKVQRLEEK